MRTRSRTFLCPLQARDLVRWLEERVPPGLTRAYTAPQKAGPLVGSVWRTGLRVQRRGIGLRAVMTGTIHDDGPRSLIVVRPSPPYWVTAVTFALCVGLLMLVLSPLSLALSLLTGMAIGLTTIPLQLRDESRLLRELQHLLPDAAAAPHAYVAGATSCVHCGERFTEHKTHCPMCGHELAATPRP